MKTQPLEFSIGYAFGDIERRAFRLIQEKEYLEEIDLALNIPKCWFNVFRPTDKKSEVDFNDREYVMKRVIELLEPVFPKWNITCTSKVNEQYQQFDFHFEKKIVRQQLTVRDIEEILGYPIEIIAETSK